MCTTKEKHIKAKRRKKMRYNYLIMDDTYKIGEDYFPGEKGIKILIEQAKDSEEIAYIESLEKRPWPLNFAFNMVYVMKQACGHYEIFQTPVHSEAEAEEWLDLMAEEAKTRKCTRCICNW